MSNFDREQNLPTATGKTIGMLVLWAEKSIYGDAILAQVDEFSI